MDIQDAHLVTAVRRPPLGVQGPNAILTPFGWCAVGRLPGNVGGSVALPVVNHLHIEALQHLEEEVEKFWRTDSFPVREAPKTFAPPLEQAALHQLRASIRHNGERYEVCVPKKKDLHRLPDNREFVRRSFLALERRLVADKDLGRAVTSGMEENIRAGYAIPARPTGSEQKVWHLKYHPVRHPHKPEKVRVVFNAAARFNGVALNDVLLKGPDLTSQLLAVFLRFRERPIGVSADIARMFYQVLMAPEDRPLFRFFWRRPGSQEPLAEFEMCVHIFGSVCSPAVCNFALQKLAEDAPEELKSVAHHVLKGFYVDNLLMSFDFEEEFAETCLKLRKLLERGGFPLVQFLSSSRKVLDKIPASARSEPELDLALDKLPTERTLGYLWNCQLDVLVFKFQSWRESDTKRLILASVSSIFDPMGLLAPVVLVAKIILQDIWRLKLNWDELLPPDILIRWRRWTEELQALENVSIRRSILTAPMSTYRSLQLHAFADASKDGFGAAVYLRAESERGVDVSLVVAKARVAPIHQLSIPKLELQGALMATRLVAYCQEEMTLSIGER